MGSAWFLDKIEVESSAKESMSKFFCERWLSKRDDDKKIERTLFAQGYNGQLVGEEDYTLEGFTSYEIKISTGPDKHMGTDANAFINLFGSEGKSTGGTVLSN